MAVALISHIGLGPVFLHSSILSFDSVRSRPSARCSLDIRSCLFRSSRRGFKQEGSTDRPGLPLPPTFAFVRLSRDYPPRPPFVCYFVHFRFPSRMLSSFFSTPSNLLLAVPLLFASVGAVPLPGNSEVAERDLEPRTVNILAASDISSFTPFTQFARAAYCQPSKIKNWNCGRESSLFPF